MLSLDELKLKYKDVVSFEVFQGVITTGESVYQGDCLAIYSLGESDPDNVFSFSNGLVSVEIVGYLKNYDLPKEINGRRKNKDGRQWIESDPSYPGYYD